MARWQLQEAKQQFSRVVDQAETEGPQVVTRHGKEVAVVVGIDDYERLRRDDGEMLKQLLLGPPYVDDLPIERSKELPRQIDLS